MEGQAEAQGLLSETVGVGFCCEGSLVPLGIGDSRATHELSPPLQGQTRILVQPTGFPQPVSGGAALLAASTVLLRAGCFHNPWELHHNLFGILIPKAML